MQCARHPNVETQLSCGRCETPVCPKCLVHAEVGIRCQTCAPRRRQIGRGLLAGGGGTILAVIVAAAIAVLLLGGGRGSSNPGFGDFPDELRAETIPFAGIGERSMGATPVLRIGASTCARIEAVQVMTCEGTIQNLSQGPLRDVRAVVEWLTANGELAAIDRGEVAFNPVLPGQTSTWSLPRPSYNPEFASYRLSFEGADGPLAVEQPE